MMMCLVLEFFCSFLVFFISENLMLVDWSLIMICFGDCFCLCGLLMWWEVMILEDVSVIFMDDVIFRSFFVVDFLGVLGILEIWMSDCWLYCFSLFNCRCRFLFFWCKRLILVCIGFIICWIKFWIFFLIEVLMDVLIMFVIFCRLLLDSVRGWGLIKYWVG